MRQARIRWAGAPVLAPAHASVLATVLASALAGCGFVGPGPEVVGDPVPGYVRIVALPVASKEALTIRFGDVGFPDNLSTVSFEFAPDERILIKFPSTPGNRALNVNGTTCEGTWTIESGVETDVLLRFDRRSCRVDVTGTHVLGAVHDDPQTEPQVDGP